MADFCSKWPVLVHYKVLGGGHLKILNSPIYQYTLTQDTETEREAPIYHVEKQTAPQNAFPNWRQNKAKVAQSWPKNRHLGRFWKCVFCQCDLSIHIASECMSNMPITIICIYILGVFFNSSAQISKKSVFQPTRIFCTSRISWNRISDWLPIIFHFGTENWEEQLKNHPVQFEHECVHLFLYPLPKTIIVPKRDKYWATS